MDRELIKKRIKEMEEIDKKGELCGMGTLALIILKASLKGGRHG